MKKYILCHLAKVYPDVSITDFADDILMAVYSASHNLYSRYKILLRKPILYSQFPALFWWLRSMPAQSTFFIIPIEIPDEIADGFNFGKRLKGISSYLLKTNKEKYIKYKDGNRLLYYEEVPDSYITNFFQEWLFEDILLQ